MTFTMAVTGHRPDKLGGYDPEAIARVDAYAFRVLETIRPDRLISGMALGWDQATARAALRLGIRLTAAVPFDGQDRKWPEPSRAEYHRLMELIPAEDKVIVSPGGYSVEAMYERNCWMVIRAKGLLAMWNGDKTGGTAHAVRYARELAVPMTNVYPGFAHFIDSGEYLI